MKTSLKFALYLALSITIFAVSLYVYCTFHRDSAVMISNALPQEIRIERITINRSKSIYVGEKKLNAKSRSFENGGDFGFTYFGIVREISVEGRSPDSFNLTCEIKNDDKYCIYKLTVRSNNNITCACDSTSDFYK